MSSWARFQGSYSWAWIYFFGPWVVPTTTQVRSLVTVTWQRTCPELHGTRQPRDGAAESLVAKVLDWDLKFGGPTPGVATVRSVQIRAIRSPTLLRGGGGGGAWPLCSLINCQLNKKQCKDGVLFCFIFCITYFCNFHIRHNGGQMCPLKRKGRNGRAETEGQKRKNRNGRTEMGEQKRGEQKRESRNGRAETEEQKRKSRN